MVLFFKQGTITALTCAKNTQLLIYDSQNVKCCVWNNSLNSSLDLMASCLLFCLLVSQSDIMDDEISLSSRREFPRFSCI